MTQETKERATKLVRRAAGTRVHPVALECILGMIKGGEVALALETLMDNLYEEDVAVDVEIKMELQAMMSSYGIDMSRYPFPAP